MERKALGEPRFSTGLSERFILVEVEGLSAPPHSALDVRRFPNTPRYPPPLSRAIRQRATILPMDLKGFNPAPVRLPRSKRLPSPFCCNSCADVVQFLA